MTSFMLGTDKFNDFDCVAFEDKNYLLRLLEEAKQEGLQYECKLIAEKSHPIIKVILAEGIMPSCELIYLPDSTSMNFLDFPFTSDSAYIRTQNGLFYVDKIQQACTEIKCSENMSIQAHRNLEMLKLFDSEMKIKQKDRSASPKGRTLSLYALHRIIAITGHVHTKLLEVDISCYENQDDILANAMKNVLSKRDFKLSALYLILSHEFKTFIIKGFNGAISSVNHKLISAVDPDCLFKNDIDLLRIFRLVKIKLKFPNFSYDDELLSVLDKTNFTQLFDDFLSKPGAPDSLLENPENIRHLRQINTKLNELFSKLDPQEVINEMTKLKIISSMTGITENNCILETASDFADYLKTVPNNYKKTAFYSFIYIHFCLSPNNQHKHSLINKIKLTLEPINETPEFEKCLAFIERNTSNRMMPASLDFKPNPDFLKMFFSIKMIVVDQQRRTQEIIDKSTPISLSLSSNI